jgi:hypothetical protein
MYPFCSQPSQTHQDVLERASRHGETFPACPVCTGSMVFLRNFYRCSRCGFCVCMGCEDLPGQGDTHSD